MGIDETRKAVTPSLDGTSGQNAAPMPFPMVSSHLNNGGQRKTAFRRPFYLTNCDLAVAGTLYNQMEEK